MENSEEQLPATNNENAPASTEEAIVFPRKYEKPEQTANIWMKSVISLTLYLVLGYYIFHSFKMLLLITAIVMFHELGHFFAMKFFRYKDLGIFFIPLLGAYVSGTKREVSQKESAIILLAGPLPGIILGILLYFLYDSNPLLAVAGIPFDTISLLLILLNLINLFPVYPLDGGQLLNRVFLDEESWISKGFVFLSAGILCWVAWKTKFPVLYIFPAMMLLRFIGEKKMYGIEKRIEAENIHIDLDYEELPDKDYWRIRNIIIEEHPAYKDIQLSPPYEYDAKEERIMNAIKGLLHRHLLQDISIAGKIFILIIWAAGIASPWLINMDMYFLHRFGL
jgi:stage IV sporulation protein FB